MKRTLLAIIAVLLVLSMACAFIPTKTPPPSDNISEDSPKDKGDRDNDSGESPDEDDGDSDGGDSGGSDDDDGDSGGGDSGGSDDDDGGDDEGLSLDENAFDQLDYYRSSIVMRFESGDETVEEYSIETANIRDPFAQHFVMTSDAEGFEMYQFEDKMYFKFGGDWMQTSSDEGNDMAEGFSNFLMDSDDLSDLQNTDYNFVGNDNKNGVKSRHYEGKYTQTWMLAFTDNADNIDIEEGTINFWVANENDLPSFIVSAVYEMNGTVDDAAAKLTMTQNVMDVNVPFTIDLPAEAEMGALPEGVPLYPNATDVTTLGGMTVFSTEDSVEDVAAFYKDNLESGGWESSEETTLGNMSTSSWSKDAETIQLTISLGDGDTGTSVMIMTGPE